MRRRGRGRRKLRQTRKREKPQGNQTVREDKGDTGLAWSCIVQN